MNIKIVHMSLGLELRFLSQEREHQGMFRRYQRRSRNKRYVSKLCSSPGPHHGRDFWLKLFVIMMNTVPDLTPHHGMEVEER